MTKPAHKVTVVVLGDVGRSPRMQYHSLSLARSLPGSAVRLVGLQGERCLDEVEFKVFVRTVADSKALSSKRIPWIVRAPLRAVRNALVLLAALVEESDTELFLVQNPPAIPTLLVTLLAGWWTGAAVIIDWHNLGFNMLDPVDAHGHSTASKGKRILAKATRAYEKYLGKLADGHISVTKALSEWLDVHFRLASKAVVLHDRPHSAFRTITEEERKHFLEKLSIENVLPQEVCEDVINRKVALLVSSTSWTPDEDFGMFLRGLELYAEKIDSASQVPRIVAVVTGKGPLLKEFLPVLEQMRERTRGTVQVYSAWLRHADYPTFLAAADLGVCMHTSTSGLDLPMKVVDMFGAGLPVCAVKFNCLDELVKDTVNGRVFSTERDLAGILHDLLTGYPSDSLRLNWLREGLRQGPGSFEKGWQQNWEETVLPLIMNMLELHRPRRRYRLCIISSLLPLLVAAIALLLVAVNSFSTVPIMEDDTSRNRVE